MKIYQRSFDGKPLFCGYLSGYTVYINHQLVESLNKEDIQKQTFEIGLPINGCDIVEIDQDILIIVPGNKILYCLEHNYDDIVEIQCNDCKTYSNSTRSMLILATGKVKLHCQYKENDENEEQEETKSGIVLLHPDGKIEYIPSEKILEYV